MKDARDMFSGSIEREKREIYCAIGGALAGNGIDKDRCTVYSGLEGFDSYMLRNRLCPYDIVSTIFSEDEDASIVVYDAVMKYFCSSSRPKTLGSYVVTDITLNGREVGIWLRSIKKKITGIEYIVRALGRFPADKVYYIVGKITGDDNYFNKFMSAVIKLQACGCNKVINPCCVPSNLPYERYAPISIAFVEACDALYVLDDWQESKGAQAEVAYAKMAGKEIIYDCKLTNG